MEGYIQDNMIHYKAVGEGFPIIIVHALGTDHRAMEAWMEPVFINQVGWQRIYIDIPAHGASRIHDSVETTEDMLNALLELIDSLLPAKKFALVAKSFGGYLAQGIFNRRVENIAGLSLIAPALHKKERTLPDRLILQKDEAMLSEFDEDIRTAFETLMVIQTRANMEVFLNEVQPGRLLADRNFLTGKWRTDGYFLSSPPFEEGKSYPQPFLLLLGKQDSIVGYYDHIPLLQYFPAGALSILDGAGHMMEIEQRVLVQHIFSDWLHRLKRSIEALGQC